MAAKAIAYKGNGMSLGLIFGLVFVAIVVVWSVTRKKWVVGNSPGSKRVATKGSTVLRDIQHQLVDELGLPKNEFRYELTAKYRNLAMAFRQSFNLAVTRYSQEFLGAEPTELIVPDLVNRIVCDYYGVILPLPLTSEGYKAAVKGFFNQKKILWNSTITPTDSGWQLVIETVKHEVLVSQVLSANPVNFAETWGGLISAQLAVFYPEQPCQPYILRHTSNEIGVAFVPKGFPVETLVVNKTSVAVG